MFDLHIAQIEPRPTYVDRNVTINRAPTDESVKLLKVMEEKAEAKLIGTFPIGSNDFNGRVFLLREYSMWESYRALVAFTMNGKHHRVDCRSADNTTVEKFLKKITEEVSDYIAQEILDNMFHSLDADSLAILRGMDR